MTERRQGSCLDLGVRGRKASNKRPNIFFLPKVKLVILTKVKACERRDVTCRAAVELNLQGTRWYSRV